MLTVPLSVNMHFLELIQGYRAHLSDRWKGKLEGQLWGAAVELQLLLLGRALLCISRSAVLRY